MAGARSSSAEGNVGSSTAKSSRPLTTARPLSPGEDEADPDDVPEACGLDMAARGHLLRVAAAAAFVVLVWVFVWPMLPLSGDHQKAQGQAGQGQAVGTRQMELQSKGHLN